MRLVNDIVEARTMAIPSIEIAPLGYERSPLLRQWLAKTFIAKSSSNNEMMAIGVGNA
jgi:hypothetical protein